jgi:hypothetical protein
MKNMFGTSTPFQGLIDSARLYPGRCPGLRLERAVGASLVSPAPKGRINISPGQRPGKNRTTDTKP